MKLETFEFTLAPSLLLNAIESEDGEGKEGELLKDRGTSELSLIIMWRWTVRASMIKSKERSMEESLLTQHSPRLP